MYSNYSWMVLASRLLMIALLIIIAICRSSTLPLGAPFVDFLVFHFRFIYRFSFIASMLLVGWQEGHPTCKILVVVINFTGDLYYNRYWHLGHVTTWQCRVKFVCDNVTVLEAWIVASSRLMEFIIVKCWLVVQKGCKYMILAPLQ